MMQAWSTLGFFVVSFLLGSIPFGLLMAKFFGGKDIRKEGSQNIGATNVSRVIGFWPAGFLTFVFDALKVGVLLGILRFYDPIPLNGFVLWSIGFLGLLGHCFSPWLGFKGGKGVAPFFGLLAALAPVTGLISGIIYGAALWLSGVGAVGSLSAVFLGMVFHVILSGVGDYFVIYLLCGLLILFRHEKNISQLLVKNGYPES